MAQLRVATAIANHIGWDVADVREHHYQSTRCHQVYSIGMEYFTAANVARKPKPFEGFKWVPEDSWIKEKYGWEVYKAEKLED